ncbi:polyprenyl synthetase family protein, partial [candidate division TA06 bacterium]|nr:polyprenyl synthetase family protein [candidate division TA06 bacterium]
VERPLHIGAALTGADPDLYEAFTTYALPFGQAFQTQDDIMGTFGDEEEIGKPTDSDIKEGKKTLLVVKALEMASKQQKNLLKRVLGNNYANESEIEMVRVVFRETGALSYAVSLSEYLLDRAKETIASSKIEDTGKQYLIAAADYLQARKL